MIAPIWLATSTSLHFLLPSLHDTRCVTSRYIFSGDAVRGESALATCVMIRGRVLAHNSLLLRAWRVCWVPPPI